MYDIAPSNRRFVAVVVVIAGLLMVTVVPVVTQLSLDAVLVNLTKAIADKPPLASGPALFTFFFPLLRALVFVAGIGLLVIARPLARGEDWSYAAAFLLSAIPAISGMFMFLPYVSFVKGQPPLPLIISGIGLLAYWTLLAVRQGPMLARLTRFFVFTLLGMAVTHSLTIGVGCLRQLMTRPNHPFYADITWWILTVTGEVVWIAAVLLLIALPLLVLQRKAGWRLAVVAAASIVAVHIPTQIIRTATWDYLVGALLSAALLTLLVVPHTRQALLGRTAGSAEPVEPATAPMAGL